jgi:flagellar basal-body rod modification protein FlgD
MKGGSGMSTVSGIGSALGSAVSQTTGSSSLVSQDTFLKLLVTQLKNQDPLSPQDSTQFVSQLASFTSLEQMSSMNKSMSSVLEMSVTNLIGKSATVMDSSTSSGYATGTITGIQYYADGPALKINGVDYPFSAVQSIS